MAHAGAASDAPARFMSLLGLQQFDAAVMLLFCISCYFSILSCLPLYAMREFAALPARTGAEPGTMMQETESGLAWLGRGSIKAELLAYMGWS